MERSEFKERLKQYKKAREENPGLKYWEWKDIPKYDEGTHRVTAGESLSSIAKKYKLNLQDLIDYNPQIKNPNIIGIGQEINIRDKSLQPTTEWVDYRELRQKERDIADSTTTINYSVKSGDSLSKIAKDNGLTLKQLLMQNPQITDPNKISIGQNLSITTTKDGNMAAIQSVSHRGNYVVIDKVNKKLTVYNKDNKPIYVTDNIATGASGDDYNTITYVDANGVIRNMQGNNSTPAGITEITGKGVYHGAKSFTRGRYNRQTGNFDDDIASSFHTGRIDIGSNGCVRLPKKELDDLNNLIRRGTKVYTLPEQEGSRFVKKDNKLSFVADSPYGTNTGKTKYWDDYNTYVDATYNPLAIAYAGDYDGLSDEYINNSTAFANALSSNKQALQKELGLDSATYNDLAELALGIAQQESNFGTSVRKKIKDAIPDEILDSVKKITRGKSSARSVGMTQIKMSADNDWMQQFYKKHNITPDNIQDSAELSAIATIGRLAHMYNNEVRGRTFTGENGINIDPIDAVLYKYMGKNKELTGKTATPEKNIYIQNVKKYANDWDLLSQTESFAEGGEVTGPRQNVLKRANKVATNYSDAKDFTLDPFNYAVRNIAKTLTGRGGISNCTLSATGWIDPNNQYMSAKNIFDNPSSGYTEIDKAYALPGDLLIAKNPKEGSYHTMLIERFNGDDPVLRYSRGGHNTEKNLVTGRSLKEYHRLDNEQGGNHTEDHYFRYNFPNEYWLPEVIVTPKR